MAKIDLSKLNLLNGDDFQNALNFIRKNGEKLTDDKYWYDGFFLYMDPTDAGYSAMIVHETTIYNGDWHLICKNGEKNNWDVNAYMAAAVDGRQRTATDYKVAAIENKIEQTTTSTVKVPTDIIDNIINYCETEVIYDKLGQYGDFYYKLKKLRN